MLNWNYKVVLDFAELYIYCCSFTFCPQTDKKNVYVKKFAVSKKTP